MKMPNSFQSFYCAALLTLCVGSRVIAQEPAGEGWPVTPAGRLVQDATTQLPAVGALPTGFLRSPDRTGPDGLGRYLIVNFSGFGVQFSAATNDAQQSVAVLDLNAKPEPVIIQNVYFPSPQSANVGMAFAQTPDRDGSYALYISGGFENRIWQFRFTPGAAQPISPGSAGPDTQVDAPFIELTTKGEKSPSDYNGGRAALYPTGIALTADGRTLLSANNLGDSLSIIRNPQSEPKLTRVDLHHPQKPDEYIYPYGVVAIGAGAKARAYVSCWNDASIAVVSLGAKPRIDKFTTVDRHPTALLLNSAKTRLFVANSDADSVSVIDTAKNIEIERIPVRLGTTTVNGNSVEGLALNHDETILYVANAHSNSVAVVELSAAARAAKSQPHETSAKDSRMLGFIPTAQYPSAVYEAGGVLYIGNGKGNGVEPSSMHATNSGLTPNPPNANFPGGGGKKGQGGEYSVAIVSGTISAVPIPDGPALATYTSQVLRNNGLLDKHATQLFPGENPIRHVIYIIKENRTYDQVFGDVSHAGNGDAADGDAALAIFGGSAAAQRPDGSRQDVSPNHHSLALRFGLFDRFFVNSEASPDGHNWATAAFSTDYVDKAFRWQYSGRGRTYDYEGFNRLPEAEPPSELIVNSDNKSPLDALTGELRRHIPYLHGSTDVAEPKTLYLWDAAERSGKTHRNYGEFVSVISQADLDATERHKSKPYPDISPAVRAIPTKQLLEANHSESFRSFDLTAPDIMTVACYEAALRSKGASDPAVTRTNPLETCRGNSRFGEWLAEFDGFVADRTAGKGDKMPALSILRFPNDHTSGLTPDLPTPQFYVAENDYAVGRLVEAVSKSPYWKDTAIFLVEDDAQDGPDHVDSHRSVALVVSAYNKPGALIHTFHSTVSMIRTIELLLGIQPMNLLDANAAPMDIFQAEADLRPYTATLPVIAENNLMVEKAKDGAAAAWMRESKKQNFAHADLADAKVLNEIIWFACRGSLEGMPAASKLPAYSVLQLGVNAKANEKGDD